MKAYHSKPELKKMMVKEAIKHRKADQLIKGDYENTDAGKFRGCAVGCTINSLRIWSGKKIGFNDHASYETELGIPRILARLEDGIFEQLPDDLAMTWPQRFLEAAPVGADLSKVGDKFLHWLLVDPQDGVIKFAKTDRTEKAIQDVADLYVKKIAGEVVEADEWKKARAYATTAAYAATYAAAATTAAYATTYAYAYAATYAATYADAYADARKAARVKQSEKLLELMAAAPVLEETVTKV